MCTCVISNFSVPVLVSTPVSRLIYPVVYLKSTFSFLTCISYWKCLKWKFGLLFLLQKQIKNNNNNTFSPVVTHLLSVTTIHISLHAQMPRIHFASLSILCLHPVPQWILSALSSNFFFFNPEFTQYENCVTNVLVHAVIISCLNHFKNRAVGLPNVTHSPQLPWSVLYVAPRSFLVDSGSCHSPPHNFHEFLITAPQGKDPSQDWLVWSIPRLTLWLHVLLPRPSSLPSNHSGFPAGH